MTSVLTAALALAATCVLPAACASAQHTATPPQPPTSTTAQPVAKSSFVAGAAAACRTSNTQLGQAARRVFGNRRPTTAIWRTFMVGTALPIISHRLDRIAALPRPDNDDATIATIVNAGKAAVTAARDNPRLLSPASPTPFDTYDRLATAYGIPGCGVGR